MIFKYNINIAIFKFRCSFHIRKRGCQKMAIIVQKFGGSSVADTDRLYNVCTHIIKEYKKGNDIVVVVSAQRKNYR